MWIWTTVDYATLQVEYVVPKSYVEATCGLDDRKQISTCSTYPARQNGHKKVKNKQLTHFYKLVNNGDNNLSDGDGGRWPDKQLQIGSVDKRRVDGIAEIRSRQDQNVAMTKPEI